MREKGRIHFALLTIKAISTSKVTGADESSARTCYAGRRPVDRRVGRHGGWILDDTHGCGAASNQASSAKARTGKAAASRTFNGMQKKRKT
jgi:hypothetical protein